MNNDMGLVDSWCQYGRSVRTNNDCEGWHNKLNRRARKRGLAIQRSSHTSLPRGERSAHQGKARQRAEARKAPFCIHMTIR